MARLRLVRFRPRSPPVHRVNDGGKRMGFTLYRAKLLSGWAELLDAAQTVVLQAGILTPDPMVSMVQKGGPHDRSLIHPPTGCSLDLQAGMIVDYPDASENEAAGPTMEVTETAVDFDMILLF
uniref:Uncharacterized protein n=1 Tax=Arundo donax TaxID=35708 RepID=A0A0A9D4U1_ARUDO